jgi:hypothetical protein
MFTVEWLVDAEWKLEQGEYFLQDGPARAAAKRGFTKDGIARRVVTYPDGREVWTTAMPPKRKQKTLKESA